MAQVKLTVDTSSLASLDLEGVTNFIAAKVERGFTETLGPLVVQAARPKAPVSEDRNFNPQRGSFKPLRLVPLQTFGPVRGEGSKAQRLQELSGFSSKQRASLLKKATGGQSSDPEITGFFRGVGANKDQTPDVIDIQGGTIKGAFKHKPGTLRDSIHVKGVRREGQRVILTVAASAPYALAVHEGFTHRGGRGHTGKATQIAPRRFFKEALKQVRDHIKNPSTYR